MKNRPNTAAVVSFLRRRRTYPTPSRRVEVIETHFAWIFLADTYAYKLKKPASRGRLDYRTIAARRRVCCDEVILNRRLAPATYLGVVPIKRSRDGTLALGESGGGRILDWVVKMHRLPAARMLDRAILERHVHKKDLQAVVGRLAKFFDLAVRQPMGATQYVQNLRDQTTQNQRDLCAPDLALNSALVTRIVQMQLGFLAEHESTVGARARHLIDGHGDLRPEHVYLGSDSDEPCVIDCLEFDSQLRWLDPAQEMALLALECRLLGASAVARTLLALFRANSPTPPSDALMDFYASESALTRAKLAAWHLRDPATARRAPAWRARTQRYLLMAARYIRRANRAPQPGLTRSDSAPAARPGATPASRRGTHDL